MNTLPTLNPIERLVSRVGGSHRFQLLMFLSFGFKWFTAATFLMSLNFLFMTQDFTCLNGENGNTPCDQYVCNNHDDLFWRSRMKEIPNTLSYQFGFFVCNREWVVSTVQSFTYWGSLVGYISVSHLADNYGRRKAEIIAWGVAAVGATVLSCSLNIYMVAAGLFLAGMGINSSITLHYTFIKEFVVGRWRQVMTISLQVMFSLGVMFIAFISIYLTHWRYLSVLVITLPILLLLPTSFLLEETPEFCIQLGHMKVLTSFNRISKINNHPPLHL